MFEESSNHLSTNLTSDLHSATDVRDHLSDEDKTSWRFLASQHTESAPFIDEEWTLAWLNAFSPPELVMASARDKEALVGLAFLTRFTENWTGKNLAVLQSITNDWSYRYEFLAQNDNDEVLQGLWSTVFKESNADIVRLTWLVEDNPTMRTGIQTANELGWSHVVIPSSPSPWRPLPADTASWDDGLKRKFKSNLRNRERRLAEQGDVTFSVARGGRELRDAMRTFLELEASGWKGKDGTAILTHREAKLLFEGLVENAADEIWIPVLRCGGKPVAAHLIRVWNRTMFLLKTAYDPEFSQISPGQIITARAFQFGIENGMTVFDFLGVPMTWKADWVPQMRPNVVLVFCAPTPAGRYAYWTRYGFKKLAKRVPGSVQLARRVRGRGGHK